MDLRNWLAYLVPLLWATIVSCRDDTSLNLHLTSGGYENYLWRSNTTAAHVLLTSPNVTDRPQRFVAALPAGNSGALAYFLPLDGSEELSVQLTNGSLQDASGDFNNVGVKGSLSFSSSATLGVTVLGAVRAMRDYVEGNGTMHEIFNYTVASANASSLHLHRKWINTTHTLDFILSAQENMVFDITPSSNGTFTPPTVQFQLPDENQPGTVSVTVLCNETTFPGLGTSGLFLNDSQALNPVVAKALRGLASGTEVNAQELSFLAYESKSLAGGWRFLTYFGRDTLIALRLLMPLFTSEASESILGAVLERLNTTGAACHEETIGDYASFINIQNNMSALGNTPFYDYKMVDTDLLLLPAVSHYFLDIPQGSGRAENFLSRKATLDNLNINETYHDLLARNAAYVLRRAASFAETPTVANLLHLRPGQPVGNWRDSDAGLGFGQIPFDVNSALVPAALRAISGLAEAGVLSIGSDRRTASQARSYAQVWETKAPGLFEVSVKRSIAESRWKDFVVRAGLSDVLLRSQSTNNISRDVDQGKDIAFYALSLRQDGTPVDILHSDLGFSLLYASNVSSQLLQHVVAALQPYPRGLLTNIGMVTANPALSRNRTYIDVLNRAAYHGTVVWSFQQALMAAGLARQLKLCDNTTTSIDVDPRPVAAPSWCADKSLVASLKEAQSRLWVSINGGRSELFSEVWSYVFDNTTNRFSVADLATLSPQGTESDAIQFWSFTFLAVADPTTD